MAVNCKFVSTLYEEQNKSFKRERDENIVTKCRSLGKYRERALLQIQSSTIAGLSEPGYNAPLQILAVQFIESEQNSLCPLHLSTYLPPSDF